MTYPIRSFMVVAVVLAVPLLFGTYACNSSSESQARPAPQAKPATRTTAATGVTPTLMLTDAEQQVKKSFERRADDYAVLHQTLEGNIADLPDQATPEQMESHRREMAVMIQKERSNAKSGEFFTPDTVALLKRILGTTLAGAGGNANKESLMDENPGALPNVGVNDHYPDGTPVATMPIELLEQFPTLPEKLEYRFLGKRLVLVDSGAAIVLDITPNVLP
jgi:hypothetical protein